MTRELENGQLEFTFEEVDFQGAYQELCYQIQLIDKSIEVDIDEINYWGEEYSVNCEIWGKQLKLDQMRRTKLVNIQRLILKWWVI